jgi:hypothetical protein
VVGGLLVGLGRLVVRRGGRVAGWQFPGLVEVVGGQPVVPGGDLLTVGGPVPLASDMGCGLLVVPGRAAVCRSGVGPAVGRVVGGLLVVVGGLRQVLFLLAPAVQGWAAVALLCARSG